MNIERTSNIESIDSVRRKRDVLKRGVYILPNSLTTASLFLGFFSILSSINGHFDKAAWAILGSAIFDAFDGTVARLTNTQSEFGQEFDSLADAIAFGVAPGILIYQWALQPFGKWGQAAAFLYVACTVLRLARFNVQASTVESSTFQGLPSPAGGGAIATTVLMFYYMGGAGHAAKHATLLAETALLGLAMISTLPYISSKNLKFLQGRVSFFFLPPAIGLLTLLVLEPEVGLFVLFVGYALSGPVMLLLRRGGRNEEDDTEAGAVGDDENVETAINE